MTLITNKDLWITDFNKLATVDVMDEEATDCNSIEFANSWPVDIDSVPDDHWNVDDDGWNLRVDQVGDWFSFVKKPFHTTPAICDSVRFDTKHCQNEKDFREGARDFAFNKEAHSQCIDSSTNRDTPRKMKASPGALLRVSLPKLLCKSRKEQSAFHVFKREYDDDDIVPTPSPARLGAMIRKILPPTPNTSSSNDDPTLSPESVNDMSNAGWMHRTDLCHAQIVIMSGLEELCGKDNSNDSICKYSIDEDELSVSTNGTSKSLAFMGSVLDSKFAQALGLSSPNEKILGTQGAFTRPLIPKPQNVCNVESDETKRPLSILHELHEDLPQISNLDMSEKQDTAKLEVTVVEDETTYMMRPKRVLFAEMELFCDDRTESFPMVKQMICHRDPPEQGPLGSRKTTMKSQDIFVKKHKASDVQQSTTVAQRHKWLQEQAFRNSGKEKVAQCSPITSNVKDVAGKFGGAVSRQSKMIQKKQQWENKWVLNKSHDSSDDKPESKARWEVCNGAYKKKIVLENNQKSSE